MKRAPKRPRNPLPAWRKTMHVLINAQPHELAEGATVADAVARVRPDADISAPFAVAVNLQFVPRAQYAHTPLRDGDRIEIIAPVVGG